MSAMCVADRLHRDKVGILPNAINRLILTAGKIAPFKVAIRIACSGVNPASTNNSISR